MSTSDTTTSLASRSGGDTTTTTAISSDGLVPRGTGKAKRLLSFFTPRRRGRKPTNNKNNDDDEDDEDDDADQNGGGSGDFITPAHKKTLSELLAERERQLGLAAFAGPLAYRQRQARAGWRGACGLDGIAEEEEEEEEQDAAFEGREKNNGGEEEEEKPNWGRTSLAVTTGGGDVALREWYEENDKEKGEVDALRTGRGPLRTLRAKLSQRFTKAAAK